MAWSLQSVRPLTEQQFDQWAQLLETRTGILLTHQQQAFLQTQITMRMRELGFSEYAEYYRRVTDGIWGKAEWSVLVDRLMVKETSFFRHPHSFECVRQSLQGRIDRDEIEGSYDVWSVGCATGEEPYSLAMLIHDCFELAQLKPYFGVFASDISMPALSKARTGIYSERRLERMSETERQHHFKDLGDGRYKVADRIQDRVCFCQGSVLDKNVMPIERMDVIFCQNLLIYFRRWRRREILESLVEHLKPGGLLMIGLGEMTDWTHPSLVRVQDDKVQAYIKTAG